MSQASVQLCHRYDLDAATNVDLLRTASQVIFGIHKHIAVSLVLMLLFLCDSYAGDVVSIASTTQEYALSSKLHYLEDSKGALTLDDLKQGQLNERFARTGGQTPNFGFTHSTYWFKVDLHNQSGATSDWLLEVQYPMLDYVNVHIVYQHPPDHILSYRGGDRLPFSTREIEHRNLLFKVPLQRGERATLYIQVKTDSSMQVPMTLWSSQALLEREHSEYLMLGAYYGIVLAMLLFNLMIYASIRDINYLYYVIYLGALLLFQSSLNGLAFEYLWPNQPEWANISIPFFMGVVAAAILSFSREFLHLRQHLPRIDRIFQACLAISVLLMAASCVVNYTTAIKLATLLAMTGAIFVLACGGWCLRSGVVHARYFMLAWTVLLLFILIYTLKTFGILPNVFITEYGLQIGAALETILLSYALAHRMRLLRLENEAIQRNITTTLEHRVQERTAELDQALANLADTNQKLMDMSHTDALTGIYNRAFFTEVFEKEWRLSYRNQTPLGLLLLDIDHFKKVNDTYGHLGGDICLKQVAAAIRSALQRPADIVFRLGGEEFVVLLPSTNLDGAVTMAERIRKSVAALEVRVDEQQIKITASIGVASIVPNFEVDNGHLIRDADLAMYEAKRNGRNRVCVYDQTQGTALAVSI